MSGLESGRFILGLRSFGSGPRFGLTFESDGLFQARNL
jgi:hypothetical protein